MEHHSANQKLKFCKVTDTSDLNRLQTWSKNYRLFWSLCLWRVAEVHSPSKDEGLKNIGHPWVWCYTQEVLIMGVNNGYGFIFGSLWHYKTRPILTKYESYFITKCNKSLLEKVRQLQIVTGLFQNVTAIIKCNFYYKIIAKCVSAKWNIRFRKYVFWET